MGRSTGTVGGKVYLESSVYDEAVKRVSAIFDEFKEIVVSISGGKDSTALFHLALAEARRRKRTISAFFIDQEAEYDSTIDIVRDAMNQPDVDPYWFQIPILMRNITSYQQPFLNAWGEGEKWMRPKDEAAIHSLECEYPKRFYDFIDWFERGYTGEDACFLVGLRAEESLNRFRSVVKNPGHKDLLWTTKGQGVVKAYPLYDWTFEDIWIYIAKNGVRYNRIYDYLYATGFHVQEMRVSNLIHLHSFKCLTTLQKFEPETYDRLVERLDGVHIAARYGTEDMIYEARVKPTAFATWRAWRDFLLLTAPLHRKEEFLRRYEKLPDDEYVAKQQCKQLLCGDFDGAVPIQKENKKVDSLKKWREIL